MTNHKAISVLESINAKTDYFLINDDARAEAIDMAISALQVQDVPDTNVSDMVSRQKAIDAVKELIKWYYETFHETRPTADAVIDKLMMLPSAQPEYEPVKAEDFAKTMSENTLYGFMALYGEVLELMEKQGFVICKKTL